MSLVVVLLDDASAPLRLGAEAMTALAGLGVSGAALVRDAETVALVLEGWAFDDSAAEQAVAAVAEPGIPHRTLRPVSRTAVTAGATTMEGDTR